MCVYVPDSWYNAVGVRARRGRARQGKARQGRQGGKSRGELGSFVVCGLWFVATLVRVACQTRTDAEAGSGRLKEEVVYK